MSWSTFNEFQARCGCLIGRAASLIVESYHRDHFLSLPAPSAGAGSGPGSASRTMLEVQ
jgi:hypothetical protein